MMGLVSEYFRRRPDVVSSLHPTHPILVHGPDAEAIVAAHPACLHPCGPGTPFDRLLALDGKVLFFNVEFAVFTFFHYLEHLVSADLPFRLYTDEPSVVPVIDRHGNAGRSRPTSIRAKRSSAVASPVLEAECGGADSSSRAGSATAKWRRFVSAKPSSASRTCGGRAATSTISRGCQRTGRMRRSTLEECNMNDRRETASFLDFAGRCGGGDRRVLRSRSRDRDRTRAPWRHGWCWSGAMARGCPRPSRRSRGAGIRQLILDLARHERHRAAPSKPCERKRARSTACATPRAW